MRRRGPPPLGFPEILDLLRRAHGARAGWGIGPADGALEVIGEEEVTADLRRRGAALVQLSSVDGRLHVVRDGEGTFVAVGDFPYGAGLLLRGADHPEPVTDAAAAALRRFVAGMRLAEEQAAAPRARILAARLSRIAGGTQTLEGIARAGAELAEQITQRGAAVVLAAEESARVLVVSKTADRRLAGLVLSAEAPVVRTITTGVPIVTRGAEDVFGAGVPERRRSERAGTAYPLADGAVVIGALVLLGPPFEPDAPVLDDLSPLIGELGPRLAAARAVHDAEQRAVIDSLTGLRNRRELDRALAVYTAGSPAPATLLYLDLDHFKRLNDALGHPAGDAALKYVARLLEAAVRDGDIVARIGGEEFAVWLPRTPLREGLEVAERIRDSLAGSKWHWSGTPYSLTISCGVAAYPEPIGDLLNLPAAADAALYRAKQAGRNRVEKAAVGH
ncbi:MAG TPA: GGDEF domain-containing protein [Gemmatimonadales bacterium]|nr:GGDEF domain-containing protein [Gemmatimonadales bacterium]